MSELELVTPERSYSPRGLFNPLKLPDTPICRLFRMIQGEYLIMKPESLFAAMGCVAANMMAGDVCWMLFVGTSSCGKSELLKTLRKVDNIHLKAAISGEQAYISGTPKDKRSKSATGGILYQLGQHCHAMLVLEDITRRFTSNLSENDKKLIAMERDIHSGDVGRDVGSDGGTSFTWAGKIGMIAGVTRVVDRYQEISGQLGERWIYFRWLDVDDQAKTDFRLRGRKENWSDDLTDLVAQFFRIWVHLEFGQTIHRDLDGTERDRITRIAQVGVRCRSAVERDQYSKHITAWTDTGESSTRMAVSLRALYLGMDRIGVPEEYCWRIVQKAALDSMTSLRMGIVKAAHLTPGMTLCDLQKIGKVHADVLYRTYQDLAYLDVLKPSRQGATTRVNLTDDVQNRMNTYFKEYWRHESSL